MSSAVLRRGLTVAALVSAALLASCANTEAERQAEAARMAEEAAIAARTPPPISLNESVAEAASIYVAFSRQMAAVEGGFADPESIQAALRQGSAYEPAQLSRGLIAYASIVALQSPEFVTGVRQYAVDRETREKLVADIVRDPRYASYLPGADAAAGLIMSTLRTDIDALNRAANSVENDAYAIQAAYDPRRSWGVAQVTDREGRLQGAKDLSTRDMLPSAEDATRLFAAAHSGTGLNVSSTSRPREAPYPPVVQNALAIAALAALGAAGDNGVANTNALTNEPKNQHCLEMSKLMLFQCLAASRPSYEDIFCVGRHIVRDLGTCTRGSALPASVAIVSDLTTTGPAEAPPAPRITPAPMEPGAAPPRPAIVVEQPARSVTEQLNATPRDPAVTPRRPDVVTTRPATSVTEQLNTTPATPRE
ncbi:hypothetical protein [Brevundimonas lenta]|uniref:Uncharacterized protein n=1 Tax=Brevundimonas lenta TaxID=424796 RepID=A0A7W6JC28_9CAUL|nr:hypothetical protein [Brevundimonas lenta]MBB4082375.1 hypothetical protein [Brevundimonas lenta]